jgi:DNA-binding MarR family transcriptional regulator
MADETRRPIGYWVKHLDGLLERAFDSTLAAKGVRRRHWQVLNALRAGPVTRAEITEALLPFWVAASVTQTDVVDDLVRRGWAEIETDTYRLTSAGQAAHAEIERSVIEVRGQIAAGFSQREFASVIDALARMAANLERALLDKSGPDR